MKLGHYSEKVQNFNLDGVGFDCLQLKNQWVSDLEKV